MIWVLITVTADQVVVKSQNFADGFGCQMHAAIYRTDEATRVAHCYAVPVE